MRFLIDENVRQEVRDFLKSRGYDVLPAPRGLKDEKIAQIAKEEKRVILTHDQHFADILTYPPEAYSGIIRIKIHPPSAPIIIRVLKDFLQKFTQRDLDKKLAIIEKDGFRIR